jgi:hypothetical protein
MSKKKKEKSEHPLRFDYVPPEWRDSLKKKPAAEQKSSESNPPDEQKP